MIDPSCSEPEITLSDNDVYEAMRAIPGYLDITPSVRDAHAPVQHAYEGTRRDLLRRRHELEPALARHGVRLRLDVLKDSTRRIGRRPRPRPGTLSPWQLPETAADLRETLVELRRWLAAKDRATA